MLKTLIIFFCVCMLISCSNDDNKSDIKTMVVEKKSLNDSLFFSGSIQPIKTTVITSPADGVIVNMPFQYGDEVKENDKLFEISSEKFISDYKTAFMQYLKSKSDFDNANTQLSEGKFLHSHELISDDDFKAKQSSYYAAQLTLLQAKDSLQIFLHDLNIHDLDLYKLSIADIDKVTQALHLQLNSSNLIIASPDAGVMLGVTKGDEDKKLSKGDTVKQGDVLAVIGDMAGISVKVKVNELTINQLQVGQSVKVTGLAFPDAILHGRIQTIDRQGEATNADMPTFGIQIIVPTLTAAQRQEIHVGMTAKVEIADDVDQQIAIPITAVEEKNGNAYVKVITNHKLIETKVSTGKTTVDSVAILSGLHVGDKILVSC